MQGNIKIVLFKLNVFLILSAFLINQALCPSLAAAQSIFNLPSSSTMIFLSESYAPALLKGIKVNPNDPLKLDFVMDLGASSFSDSQLNEESIKLIKYFLASLAIPNADLWVNLSPYEKDKIIPLEFGQTEMGRDLLAQDYMLKQITASLMYPENELGKAFWEKVYAKAQKQYGTTDIPLNTFNKVWIIPDKAVVYENGDTAFIVESHLKVMLEGDYVALNKGVKDMSAFPETAEKMTEVSDLSAAMVREIILPALEKEVNEGKNFVQLRQMYSSLVLATWYKRALKDSLLGKIYIEKKKIDGVQVDDKEIKQKIYNQYLEAFKNGLYNYMKEEYDPVSQSVIPRKYFSGGVKFTEAADKAMLVTNMAPELKNPRTVEIKTSFDLNSDQAMVVDMMRRKADINNTIESAVRIVRDAQSKLEKLSPLEEQRIIMDAEGNIQGVYSLEEMYQAIPDIIQRIANNELFDFPVEIEIQGGAFKYSPILRPGVSQSILTDSLSELAVRILNQLNRQLGFSEAIDLEAVKRFYQNRLEARIVTRRDLLTEIRGFTSGADRFSNPRVLGGNPNIIRDVVRRLLIDNEDLRQIRLQEDQGKEYDVVQGLIDKEGSIVLFDRNVSGKQLERRQKGEVFEFTLRISQSGNEIILDSMDQGPRGLDNFVVAVRQANARLKAGERLYKSVRELDPFKSRSAESGVTETALKANGEIKDEVINGRVWFRAGSADATVAYTLTVDGDNIILIHYDNSDGTRKVVNSVTLPMREEPYIVGRQSGDIIVSDSTLTMSRTHLSFSILKTTQAGRYLFSLRDLNTTNGTTVARVVQDQAMAGEEEDFTKGGIDFNPDQLDIEKRGKGVKFNVNIPEELRNLNADSINGITPIILQIVPIINLPIFLGVNEKQSKEEASYL